MSSLLCIIFRSCLLNIVVGKRGLASDVVLYQIREVRVSASPPTAIRLDADFGNRALSIQLAESAYGLSGYLKSDLAREKCKWEEDGSGLFAHDIEANQGAFFDHSSKWQGDERTATN